jgi:hypothetical protein
VEVALAAATAPPKPPQHVEREKVLPELQQELSIDLKLTQLEAARKVPQQPKRALLRVSHWITGPEWEKMFDDQAAEKEAKKNAPKKPRGRPPKVPAGQALAKGSRGKAKAKAAKEESEDSSSSDESDS